MKYLMAPYLGAIVGIEVAVWIGFERNAAYVVFMLLVLPIHVWVFVRYLIPIHWGDKDRYFRVWLYEGTEKFEKELKYHEDMLKNDVLNLMRLFYVKQ